jgi:hypothetical protein
MARTPSWSSPTQGTPGRPVGSPQERRQAGQCCVTHLSLSLSLLLHGLDLSFSLSIVASSAAAGCRFLGVVVRVLPLHRASLQGDGILLHPRHFVKINVDKLAVHLWQPHMTYLPPYVLTSGNLCLPSLFRILNWRVQGLGSTVLV